MSNLEQVALIVRDLTATSRLEPWASSSPAASACSCGSMISAPRTRGWSPPASVSSPRRASSPYGRVAVFLDLEGNRWDLFG